jgi:Tfp pilus assembly protein PilF
MQFRHSPYKFRCFQLGAALLAAFLVAPAVSAPRTPPDANTVIEKLPFRAGDKQAKALAELRASLAQTPDDLDAAVALAQAYFDMALARGDPRYVGYADAIVARFGARMTPDLLLVRGTLRQYRHDFAAAIDDFAAALAQDPQRAGAHAWRGAIYLVEAQYADAAQECAALQQLQRPVLHGGCAGLLQAYTGQLAGATTTLQKALAATHYDDQRLWLLTRLGEVAAWRGQPDVAERHYRQALALGQDDGYLLAAWADFLLDQKRPAEVAKLLATWEASDGLLLRLAEAETLLQLPAATAHIQALDDRFAAAKLRGDTTHRAEEARFQLRLRHNPAMAVQLAAANYAVQKEPRDLRVLLEAALAAKDFAAAQAGREWLQSSGFEDAQLRALAAQTAQLPVAKMPAAQSTAAPVQAVPSPVGPTKTGGAP